MKKAILIASITVCLLGKRAEAQVVTAGGVTIKLTTEHKVYLRRFKSKMIDQALDTATTIRYNTTADVIIMLLKDRKRVTDTLIAKRKN
jgi:hypothetical protein